MDNRWIRKTLQKAEPYVVPAISESIVINANESPYTIFDFPEVRRDYEKRFARFRSCRYPDPYAEELRLALSGYMECEPGEILVGNGGDEIIGLTVNTFINPGDTVLTHWPTFDMYGIDAVMIGGREVRVPDEDGFVRNAAAYRRKVEEVQPKLTVICNPNNPTGALLSLHELKELIEVARKYNTYIICDEVYRHVLQDDQVCPSIADLYEKGISVGSMSKACSMAGIRLGWIATKDKQAMQNIKYHIGYDMSSVGGIKEYIAAIALKYKKALIDRNMSLLRVNLITLDGWLRQNKNHLSYVYPKAGSTVLVFYDYDVPSEKLCSYLYNTTGTLITPGDIFNVPHSFRISYACDHRQLLSGLVCLSEVCEKLNNNPHFFDDINP